MAPGCRLEGMDHSHHALDSLGGLSEGRIVGLMGTDVRVVAWARTQEAATTAQEAAFEEMVRLQSIFSIYDPTSAISRWRRGEDFEVPDELTIALGQARHWFDQSGHAFHPASRALHARWQRAATEGVVPSRDEMQEMADAIAVLPWEFGAASDEHRIADCSGVDLNAFAKGWIVDNGLGVGSAIGVTRIGVNAGGDLAHLTQDAHWKVGVEDPPRPSDNGADRLCTLSIGSQAVATSGLARRGFRVGDDWFGHVIDPRTGWPVEHVAQVSVVATDAATADALATVCGVLPLDEGIAFVEATDGCEALVVPADKALSPVSTSGWQRLLA